MTKKHTPDRHSTKKSEYKNQDKHRWRKFAAWAVPFVIVPVGFTVFAESIRGVWLAVFAWVAFFVYCLLMLEWLVWRESYQRRWIRTACIFLCVATVVVGIIWQRYVPPRTDRPELLMVEATMKPFIEGQPWAVQSWVQNTGKATAYHITLCTGHHFTDKSFSGPLVYSPIYPNQVQTIQDFLPPGGPYAKTASTAGAPITKEHITAVINGDAMLFYVVRGQYEGESGNKYPIRFCFQYDPKRTDRQMWMCPDRFKPKEDDPNKDCPN